MAAGMAALLPATVQAITLGAFEYRNSCAQCHGLAGKGDGPVASSLTEAPADLTVLQKKQRRRLSSDESLFNH